MTRNYSNGAAVTERRHIRANNDAGVARRVVRLRRGKRSKIFSISSSQPGTADIFRAENSYARTHLLLLNTRYFIRFFTLI